MFLEKLIPAENRYKEIEQLMTLPEITSDGKKYTALVKEYNSLTQIVEKYREYKSAKSALEDAIEMRDDSSLERELRDMAEEEARECASLCERLEGELQLLLIPKDPNDSRNVVIEIRQGAGGEEAALFAADIFRMYSMFAAKERFTIDSEFVVAIADRVQHPLYKKIVKRTYKHKEITFSVIGEGAYSKFKFESGVHRVQRIPVTESNGRIQTSTVTVAVLPEVEEVEVDVNPADLKFESCKSSGAGGQHINKTESAVRLTHKPSGIVIECDQERSQLQNKEKALRILYTKLYDMKQKEQTDALASQRRSQVGSGDRSEKIRTYNYPQSRITDHRINKTVFTFEAFLNGDIGELVNELIAFDTAERLRGEN